MLLTLSLAVCALLVPATWAQDAHPPAPADQPANADAPAAATHIPIAALPGRALSTANTPALADDHGTRAGARFAGAAIDAEARVALVFTEGKSLLVSSGSVSAGLREPVRIEAAHKPASGSFWGPQIARCGSAVTVVAVLAEKLGRDGDVVAWHSADGGRSFGEPARLNTLEGAAQELLVQLAAGDDGRLAAAWMHTENGVVSLHGAESRDAGATWSVDRLLHASAHESVCPCCPPVLAFGAGDALWMLFRDDLDGYRDSHLLDLRDPEASPVRLGRERWELGGCPMSVGALHVRDDGPHAVYRRGDTLFLAQPTTQPAAARLPTFSEQELVDGRWPLRALRADAPNTVFPPALFWRVGQKLHARLPGDWIDRDLGPARRVALADTRAPRGPLLLAAELDDGTGGWQLSLRLLRDRVR
ncbi:MAG: hypothetical protein DHS20C15_13040 [Planctomycetota bacterium]|nr:MAG: hypothetical protein DHS20C15_13040 [Planctomycetota bacterium]